MEVHVDDEEILVLYSPLLLASAAFAATPSRSGYLAT
jgi:hypothetical protein